MPSLRDEYPILCRHYFAVGFVPGLATEGRSIDAVDKAEARRKAEGIIVPMFPEHADVEIMIQEIVA
jgi:hypothetical protein